MSRSAPRTQPCSTAQGRTRLEHAQKFLDVAELVAGEGADIEYASAATALAVLAGIAASDAACCTALRRRARGQEHRQATELVEQIEPGGERAAQLLQRLLSLKDEAHYGLFDIGGQDLRAALRQARALVKFATDVMRGAA
ncbi:MAG TPA: hypothetical protein VMU55_00110 [Solirubrobacteraceae bacterium]|nr:hypothetical protein [Solirubrobacteraceae bacterium]